MNLKPHQIILISFVSVIFIGSLLLYLPFCNTSKLSYIDAVFTATSATCVTGLIVKDTPNQFTFLGEFVILVLIQLGGLGLMTFSIFFSLMLRKKLSIKDRLVLKESLTQYPVENFSQILRNIIMMVLCFEIIGALFLFLRFKFHYNFDNSLWIAVFHSVSAFCNAGFSLFSNSLNNFYNDGWIIIPVMLLIIIGGIGFIVIYEIKNLILKRKFYRNKPNLSFHSKAVLYTTFILILTGFILLFVFEYNSILKNKSFIDKAAITLFQAVTPRTAGFNTIDINTLTVPSIVIIILLMFVGGSSGSTAGGIKTTTIFVIFNYLRCTLKGHYQTFVFKKNIPRSITKKAVTILILSSSIVIAGIVMLTITEDINISLMKNIKSTFLEIVFEAVSAFGTVGLSLGITPMLARWSKVIIILLMFIGRLGPLLIVLSIFEKEEELKYEFPDENILIG